MWTSTTQRKEILSFPIFYLLLIMPIYITVKNKRCLKQSVNWKDMHALQHMDLFNNVKVWTLLKYQNYCWRDLMVIFKGLLFLITLLICRNSAKRVQRILINPEQVSAVSILQHQSSHVTITEECWYIITNWSPHCINISVTFACCLFFFFLIPACILKDHITSVHHILKHFSGLWVSCTIHVIDDLKSFEYCLMSLYLDFAIFLMMRLELWVFGRKTTKVK